MNFGGLGIARHHDGVTLVGGQIFHHGGQPCGGQRGDILGIGGHTGDAQILGNLAGECFDEGEAQTDGVVSRGAREGRRALGHVKAAHLVMGKAFTGFVIRRVSGCGGRAGEGKVS